jgi:hypothetical protein
VAVLPAAAGLTGDSYADPAALTAGWQTAMVLCAVLCVAGGLLALGIRNDVLAPAEPTVVATFAAPRPGDCFNCGIVEPPTHIVPVGRPAPAKPDEAA